MKREQWINGAVLCLNSSGGIDIKETKNIWDEEETFSEQEYIMNEEDSFDTFQSFEEKFKV